MGQKTNPIGFRVGYNKSWGSMWYSNSNSYSRILYQDYLIRNFLNKIIKAKISRIIIERSHNKTIISIYCDKPGLVIGKKGSEIEKIRNDLCKQINLTDMTINVLEEKKIDLDASIVAQNIAFQLEKRASHKRVMKRAVVSAMKANAKGIMIKCSGRLAGAEIARRETLKDGSIPLSTISANICYAHKEAHTIYGIIGIKVWIYKE